MPAATTILLATGLAVGAASSTAQVIQGSKQQKAAKKALDNFQATEIENAYKNLAPSTAGAELQAETVSRQAATMSEQAGKAGARGVVGASGQIAEFETQNMRQIAAYLDERQKEYQTLIAQGEMQAQQLKVQQEGQELAGIGNLMNVGQQNLFGGLNNLANTAISASSLFAGTGGKAGDWFQGKNLPKAQSLGIESIDLTSGNTVTPPTKLPNQFME